MLDANSVDLPELAARWTDAPQFFAHIRPPCRLREVRVRELNPTCEGHFTERARDFWTFAARHVRELLLKTWSAANVQKSRSS